MSVIEKAKCACCGASIKPTSHQRAALKREYNIYCNDVCRDTMRHKMLKARIERKKPLKCPQCGKKFLTTSSGYTRAKRGHPVCCCRSCAGKLRRKKMGSTQEIPLQKPETYKHLQNFQPWSTGNTQWDFPALNNPF